MKILFNIILFLPVAFSCKQDTCETIELLKYQVYALENEIIILADSNARLLTLVDSLLLTKDSLNCINFHDVTLQIEKRK